MTVSHTVIKWDQFVIHWNADATSQLTSHNSIQADVGKGFFVQ